MRAKVPGIMIPMVFVLAAIALSGPVSATQVLCENQARNHMLVSSSQVSACLDAGVGNLTGNPANDLFLNGTAGDAYHPDGNSDETGEGDPFNLQFTQDGNVGTWGFDASFWNTHSDGAIGFKFGTGNRPDEWFVYSLVSGVSSGTWEFVNVFDRGGGLSHLNLYGIDGRTEVSEPTTLSMFGAALLLLALASRRRSAVA